VRLYDRLFTVEQPDASGDFLQFLNPASLSVATRARLEPALRDAAPGSHWQFLRVGYFFVDPVESGPGAPVFNRTMTLKDTWTGRATSTAESAVADGRRQARASREIASTGPSARAQADVHADRRSASPELATAHARIAALPGVGPAQADVLAADAGTIAWFDATVAAGAPAGGTARWIVNELRGLAGERALDALPLSPAAFAAFVSLAESGSTTAAGAKSLLASLVERSGDPAARLAELGLEKVDDHAVVDAAVARVLAAQAAEVARYRAGEAKLLGFLLGAAMRETKGKADPGAVRATLLKMLG